MPFEKIHAIMRSCQNATKTTSSIISHNATHFFDYTIILEYSLLKVFESISVLYKLKENQ